MPYITQENRDNLTEANYDDNSVTIYFDALECGGDLNYLFTMLAAQYLKNKGIRYQNISDVLGAYNGSQREIERLIIDPYEELTHTTNGSIPQIDWAEQEIENRWNDFHTADQELENLGEVVPFKVVENE